LIQSQHHPIFKYIYTAIDPKIISITRILSCNIKEVKIAAIVLPVKEIKQLCYDWNFILLVFAINKTKKVLFVGFISFPFDNIGNKAQQNKVPIKASVALHLLVLIFSDILSPFCVLLIIKLVTIPKNPPKTNIFIDPPRSNA
jgi:hypothetical protein